jgi:dihydrofolate reductase
MGKLIVTEFTTLDGVIESPELWSLNYWSEEASALKMQELESSSALLLGRVTYDSFAAAWPGRSGDPYSDKFNAMPKYVVSSGSPSMVWNNSHLVGPDWVAAITALKDNEPGDIVVHGSATLARSLLKAELVDQITLMIYPVVRGQGLKLFDGSIATELECTDAKRFSNGVIATTFVRNPVNGGK